MCIKKILAVFITSSLLLSACGGGADNNLKLKNEDDDRDRVINIEDNCLSIANTDQLDTNGNGIGDACDITSPTDTIAPEITVIGLNPMKLSVGDTFSDPGAKALDGVDGDLTAAIQSSSNVNTPTAGTYMVTYSVSDATGNVTTVKRSVIVNKLKVVDNTPSVGGGYYLSTTGSDSSDGSAAHPWKTLKYGVSQLSAGDTLNIRGGHYRIPQLNISKSGTASAPITIRGVQGEKATISVMTAASSPSDWTKVSGKIYEYSNYKSGAGYRHVSQDGIPSRLMIPYSNYAGSYTNLKGPGQWSRNTSQNKLWIWSKDGSNPGNTNTEVSFYNAVIKTERSVHHVVFDNLTVEGGYYPFRIKSSYTTIKNSVVRNAFGDAIKLEGWDQRTQGVEWNAIGNIIENNDIYYFGENGIDNTGHDGTIIRNTKIHDGIRNRYLPDYDGYKTNGIIIKNFSEDVIVENCEIYNMQLFAGAINLGSTNDIGYATAMSPTVDRAIIRNNIFRDLTGTYIVSFSGAHNSYLVNNIFYHNIIKDLSYPSSPYALVQIRDGTNHANSIPSENNTIANNIFSDNNFTQAPKAYVYSEYKPNTAINTMIDNNIVSSPQKSYFESAERTYSQLQNLGYDVHSETGTPEFLDINKNNVELLDGSVGIGQGMDLRGIVDYDKLGNKRTLPFDIGPFQK